jgi:hypothetical protein
MPEGVECVGCGDLELECLALAGRTRSLDMARDLVPTVWAPPCGRRGAQIE